MEGLLALLHWVAGVSYYKTALPPVVSFEADAPNRRDRLRAAAPPAVAALLEALYSEGLAELAYTNRLPGLPRPRFVGLRYSELPIAIPHPRPASPAPILRTRHSAACWCR